jgi:predicted DsbA family dithiol-disulfide isomerase
MSEVIIEVVSDAVCPWCFVGKRRLEAALARDGAADVSVRWRPYQLDPTIPAGGLPRREYMRAKFRDDARLAEAHARLAALGAEVGIKFDFEAISRAPNTLDAHRVIRWASGTSAGARDRVVERLFSDYFERGRDIGDPDVLVEAAEASGMDGAIVRSLLATPDDVAEVRAEIEQAQRIGVSGVPFFIFASKFAVSGAQSVDVLARALAQARGQGGTTAVA